ncbi:hypothetical protein CRYUN_Cryun22dG0064500 [Craigia yunnanensis]
MHLKLWKHKRSGRNSRMRQCLMSSLLTSGTLSKIQIRFWCSSLDVNPTRVNENNCSRIREYLSHFAMIIK